MKRFPARVPRKMFWSKEMGSGPLCPECGSMLEKERHTYVMAVREGGDARPFIVGSEGGHFCEQCSTVVLEHNSFAELAALGLGHGGEAEFMVLGLVDLEAIPKEKAAVPLGSEGNPLPWVKFTNLGQRRAPPRGQVRLRAKKKGSRQKKKGR